MVHNKILSFERLEANNFDRQPRLKLDSCNPNRLEAQNSWARSSSGEKERMWEKLCSEKMSVVPKLLL